MSAGMVVLGLPALLAMATIMTGPMVAWMRRMGHSWRPCLEMAASMYVPTFAVIALMAGGSLDFATAMMWEHVAMLPSMLFVMLLRREGYSCHPHHRAQAMA